MPQLDKHVIVQVQWQIEQKEVEGQNYNHMMLYKFSHTCQAG
jgi:hypothetical protein